jgi:hypothetical protein
MTRRHEDAGRNGTGKPLRGGGGDPEAPLRRGGARAGQRPPADRRGVAAAASAVPRLKEEVTGSDSDRLNGALLRAVLGCVPCSAAEAPGDRERRAGAALDAVAGFGPRDGVEGMLAAQAVAMHLAGMAALQRSQRPDLPAEVASRLRRDGAGLCRGVAEMAEAIERRRGGGARQVVRVERVVVQEGGQAIVGAVAPPGGGGGAGGEPRARGEGGGG